MKALGNLNVPLLASYVRHGVALTHRTHTRGRLIGGLKLRFGWFGPVLPVAVKLISNKEVRPADYNTTIGLLS